jgi:hypothetical protein
MLDSVALAVITTQLLQGPTARIEYHKLLSNLDRVTYQAVDHLVDECRHLLAAQRLAQCPKPWTYVDGGNIGPECEGLHVADDGVGDGVVTTGPCLLGREVEDMVCVAEAITCRCAVQVKEEAQQETTAV